MKTTLYQLKKTGKIWQWSCWAQGPKVYTSYGYVDGAQQETHETATAVNVGKSNEVSPVEQARLIAERKIKEKLENGYARSPSEAKLEPEGLDYDNLPKAFTPAKPISSIDEAKLRKLFDAGNLSVQRKYDGCCLLAVRGSSGIKLLTRGKLEDKTGHFPQIVNELKDIPVGTILVGELIGQNFKTVTSILRSKDPHDALEKQREAGRLSYMIFDVLHWDGEDITSWPYNNRINKILAHLDDKDNPCVQVTHNLLDYNSYDELFGKINIAIVRGYEGYVCWQLDAPTKVRLDGKEERTGAWKWKITHSEDVWAECPTEGKGKNEGKLGQVKGYQFSPTGEKVYVGDIGGGYSNEERLAFWQQRDTLFPCVIEIETSSRLISGKLQFPVFVRLRPDKTEAECLMQLEYKGD